MGFLDNYEDVNARIKRFRSEFPSGRLIAFIEDVDLNKGTVLIRAEAYREYEDAVPSAVDYAFGNVATLTNNMKKWLIEDTVTSAYGRVIGLLTPSLEHNARPTVQDMQKVENLPADPDPWSTKAAIEDMPTMATAVQEIASTLGGEQVAEAPQCHHGHMVWRQQTKEKLDQGGKNWGGYMCPEKLKANQCTPRWYVLASDGKWKPQV
jgi:hypothetical protein